MISREAHAVEKSNQSFDRQQATSMGELTIYTQR
jgi:hypothetical protein